MNKVARHNRYIATVSLILALLSSALPCGPGYTTPLFDTTGSPENPWSEYAAGRLGIVKPTFHRSVLIAAYRHIAGNGLNAAEQRALVDVWTAEIKNKDHGDDTVDDVVQAWVKKRKEVFEKEEKPPEIYAERAYGGYDFFPNCTKNAFETATETLSDRIAKHGPSDANVIDWTRGQDQVFQNCSSGKRSPDDAPPGAPVWLQKDRAYQRAAAEFYSLDYEAAKRHFAEIAQDSESPWAETADYLVARTLIRQASLSKDAAKTAQFYEDAERHLQKFASRSGKFFASAERMLGLIAYRLRPKERVSELAKKIAIFGGNDNFRQDVIDYTWLMDKFEAQILSSEQMRKLDEEMKETLKTSPNANKVAENSSPYTPPKIADDELQLVLYSPDDSTTWRFVVKTDATDDDAIVEAEKVVGRPLTDSEKTHVKDQRRTAYSDRFHTNRDIGYDGGNFGDEKLSPSLMPDFLRQDELTDWLFTYQMPGAEAYIYSLDRFKSTGSELWLMTALAKAEKSSTQLARLLEAAEKANTSSPAYTTIAYHTARIHLALGKNAEARKLIDEMLASGDLLTISARNSFQTLKLDLAETMEDFLRYSLLRPYGFDFDGSAGTIDEFIAEQKKWYNPEYSEGKTREQYEAEVEARFTDEKLWQSRGMFDYETIETFNQHFPTVSLIDVMNSPALPDYMRRRFAIAIWTRAFLLSDMQSLNKAAPELIKAFPEFEEKLARVNAAKTPTARERALLYFVLKNPVLSPYIEDGMGRMDNTQEQWSSDDWWCEPYDSEYNDATNSQKPKQLPRRPAFLSPAQSSAAQAERKRLKALGDAPKFLAERVMTWARRSPMDRRVPEALYIMIEANGWTKYGCGNNEELRDQMAALLKSKYPNSEWTKKLITDESSE
ncbi:MAG: hypothetical protein ACKVQW_02945 [Pyrinomonadaceae bacterium]